MSIAAIHVEVESSIWRIVAKSDLERHLTRPTDSLKETTFSLAVVAGPIKPLSDLRPSLFVSVFVQMLIIGGSSSVAFSVTWSRSCASFAYRSETGLSSAAKLPAMRRATCGSIFPWQTEPISLFQTLK